MANKEGCNSVPALKNFIFLGTHSDYFDNNQPGILHHEHCPWYYHHFDLIGSGSGVSSEPWGCWAERSLATVGGYPVEEVDQTWLRVFTVRKKSFKICVLMIFYLETLATIRSQTLKRERSKEPLEWMKYCSRVIAWKTCSIRCSRGWKVSKLCAYSYLHCDSSTTGITLHWRL